LLDTLVRENKLTSRDYFPEGVQAVTYWLALVAAIEQ
jgi:hypothetical protein